jgi:Ca2+-binding RTX toxin-like protein
VLAADIVGTNGPDVLEGTPQADSINGRGGADVMMGLAGNDTYTVDLADDESSRPLAMARIRSGPR